jgi:hypothetical protein
MSPPTVPRAFSDSLQNSHCTRSSTEALAQALFNIYIVIVLALPTGNLLGVNVKYLLFVTLFAISLYRVFKRGIRYTELALLHVIPMILCIGLIIAALYGYHEATFAVIQYSFIATTIVGCWLISLCVPNRGTDSIRFVRLVILTMVAIAVAKAMIVGYSFSTGVPIFKVLRAVSDFFHAGLMGGELESIGGRIEFVSDTLIPSSIFALLFLRKRLRISAFHSVVFVTLLTFSSVMSFSRFFWAHTLVAVALGLTNIRKNRANLVYVVMLIVLGLYCSNAVSLLVSERFSAALAGVSDLERIVQIAALKEFALDAPWFGHGLGTFTNQSVRVWAAPYNYEVQGLALVGQVGLVGVGFLLGLLCLYCKDIFKIERGQAWYRICLIALFAITIAGCFFNPYLFSSTASINYGLLAVLARIMND